jgi:hypothetical protein
MGFGADGGIQNEYHDIESQMASSALERFCYQGEGWLSYPSRPPITNKLQYGRRNLASSDSLGWQKVQMSENNVSSGRWGNQDLQAFILSTQSPLDSAGSKTRDKQGLSPVRGGPVLEDCCARW